MTLIDYCPLSIPVTTVPSTSLNFGHYCPTAGNDYASIIHSAGFVPGQSRVIPIQIFNLTCSSGGTATVKIIPDPLLTYDNTIAPSTPVTISGDTIIFQVTLGSNFSVYNYFYFTTATTATIGDTLCVDLITTPAIGDLNPANNYGEFCFPVTSSYDPNDKLVYPRGTGAAGNIAADQELTYTIDFQNTGTEYAYNIHVDDTLDADLDINTFRVLSSSHYMYVTWPAPNVVRFNYDNVYLPDSSMDLLGSMGHVIYSIGPVSGIAIGTQITNSAAIYFDYNAPVITNNTLNTISSTAVVPVIPELSSSFDVYPNPAVNDVNIRINKQGIFSVEILNMTGDVVKTISNINTGERTVSMSEFGSGIYLVRLLDGNNQTSGFKKIIVQ